MCIRMYPYGVRITVINWLASLCINTQWVQEFGVNRRHKLKKNVFLMPK